MTECRFTLPIEMESVPTDLFGIYAFRLCLPGDARLGLTAKTATPTHCTDELVARTHRLRQALNDNQLFGRLETIQAPHLAQGFSLSAEPLLNSFHTQNLRSLIEVRIAASVLRYTIDMSLPLYVGMTAKQSFRQRLEQHMAGSSQFSNRLKVLKISWSDLQFAIRPLDVPRGSVLAAERLAQSLLRPKVSIA
jgi:hypothetical protein